MISIACAGEIPFQGSNPNIKHTFIQPSAGPASSMEEHITEQEESSSNPGQGSKFWRLNFR
jgi:hypothetical protein